MPLTKSVLTSAACVPAAAVAPASAGTNAAEVKTDFVNGMAIFQMTEKGLMANADIAGTKYWKNDKLN